MSTHYITLELDDVSLWEDDNDPNWRTRSIEKTREAAVKSQHYQNSLKQLTVFLEGIGYDFSFEDRLMYAEDGDTPVLVVKVDAFDELEELDAEFLAYTADPASHPAVPTAYEDANYSDLKVFDLGSFQEYVSGDHGSGEIASGWSASSAEFVETQRAHFESLF